MASIVWIKIRNGKNTEKYFNIIRIAMLIALIPIVSAGASASVSRNIEDLNLSIGGSTNITATMTSKG